MELIGTATSRLPRIKKKVLNPTNGRRALKAPLKKIVFLAPFCYPIDPKKCDFSILSMTMPPIVFQVSVAFLS